MRIGSAKGFVKISAGWSSVFIGKMSILLLFTYCRKWCSFMLICFVLGLYLCSFTIASAPMLSSYTSQYTLGFIVTILILFVPISLIISIIGIASRNACDSAQYSASVVLRDISTWIWDFQHIGHPAYVMIYPCRDRAISTSSLSSRVQLPEKSVYMYTRSPWLFLGVYFMP